MNKRYNVTAPRKYPSNGEEKTHWLKVGTAFENDKGGFDITLDALPAPEADRRVEGQFTYRLKAFDAANDSPRGGGGSSGGRAPQNGGDDDIPF